MITNTSLNQNILECSHITCNTRHNNTERYILESCSLPYPRCKIPKHNSHLSKIHSIINLYNTRTAFYIYLCCYPVGFGADDVLCLTLASCRIFPFISQWNFCEFCCTCLCNQCSTWFKLEPKWSPTIFVHP